MRLLLFIIRVFKESAKDDLFAMAGQLTYKMLLAFFPFLIFLIALMGFMDLDEAYWMQMLSAALPDQTGSMLEAFFDEVIHTRSFGILSASLLIAFYHATSGFFVVMRCVNLTYGQKNSRNFFVNHLISSVLVLMFSISLISMLVLMIFNDMIYELVIQLVPTLPFIQQLFAFVGILIASGVLLITTMMVYKLSNCRKPKLRSVMPGAIVTVGLWVLSSKAFNLYINNFTRYSRIYGSIAGVFILIIWLNIISTALLLGSKINFLLDKSVTAE